MIIGFDIFCSGIFQAYFLDIIEEDINPSLKFFIVARKATTLFIHAVR